MTVTPEMIGSFVKVFTAEVNLSGDLKYSIQLMIDKADKEGVAKIKAMIEKAKAKGKETKWGGKVPKFRYEPLRDGDAELESGEKEDGVTPLTISKAFPLKLGDKAFWPKFLNICDPDEKAAGMDGLVGAPCMVEIKPGGS